MADSALSLDIFSLRSEIAYFLGKGQPDSQEEWRLLSDSDRRMIDAHIAAGLRTFYSAYDWSFLKPWSEFNLSNGTWRYDLPDDFGFLRGTIFVSSNERNHPLTLIGQTQVMGLSHSKRGIPRYYAISPKPMPAMTGQRFELLLWPTPEASMTLVIQYSVVPRTITTNSPYPYGGMFHAETIREACLAAAESDTDDQVGLHQQLYEQKLKASIAFDIDQSVADFLGYNGDGTRCYRSRLGLTLNVNNINVSTPLPGNGGHSSSGEQNMANEVFHDFITRSAFNSMSKNDNWLYFVSETDGTINLYKGNTLVSQAVTLVSSFPSVGETGRLYLCLSPLALKTWAGEWKTLLPAASGQAGKSAYEIWLDNGHTGTEADFLASLHGQAPTLTVNSCTTLDPGQPAFFRITGTSPNLFVDVGIPKGDTTQGDLSSPTVELYVSQFGENITSYLPQLSDGNYHYLTLDANCIDYPSILTPVISDFSTTLVVEIYDNRTEGNRGISVKGHNFDHIAGRNWLITFWNGGNGVCATVDQIYR